MCCPISAAADLGKIHLVERGVRVMGNGSDCGIVVLASKNLEFLVVDPVQLGPTSKGEEGRESRICLVK